MKFGWRPKFAKYLAAKQVIDFWFILSFLHENYENLHTFDLTKNLHIYLDSILFYTATAYSLALYYNIV